MPRATVLKRMSMRILNNLTRTYAAATDAERSEGLSWYQQAHDFAGRLAQQESLSIEAVVGVMAALSPGREWVANLIDAQRIIHAWNAGARGSELPLVGVYGRANTQKAARILAGESPLDVLGGLKVRSFYSNILDPQGSADVTIDRHAKCCALGVKSAANSVVKNSEYPYLAKHFRKCAAKYAITPSQFQAVVWVAWRNSA